MKIVKRNGNITLYDENKVVSSILRANAETNELLSNKKAALIADEVFSRLTEKNEIITTSEIWACLISVLREMGYFLTARQYAEFKKQ